MPQDTTVPEVKTISLNLTQDELGLLKHFCCLVIDSVGEDLDDEDNALIYKIENLSLDFKEDTQEELGEDEPTHIEVPYTEDELKQVRGEDYE